MKKERVLVIGASENKERYSYIAAKMLIDFGHVPVLFGSRKGEVFGLPIYNEWQAFGDIDTVTLYINPQRQEQYEQKILDLKPKRVIFNPGTENPAFYLKLNEHNIIAETACTLVLLSTGQY